MKLNLHTSTLPNGIRVTTATMPHVAAVTIGMWIKVGGRNETARLNGMSHFIEHMLFKGTRTRNAKQLSQAIEGRGGYLDAYTQEELTCFYARATAEHADEVFAVLADMMLNPKFAPADIGREREVIVEEIAMYRDQPAQQVDEHLMAALWPGHPLGRPITGTEKTLAGMTRAEILNFKSAHYISENIVIGLAGDIKHPTAVSLAKKWFGGLTRRAPPAHEKLAAGAPQENFALEKRRIDQTHLALGFRTFGRYDERKYAMKLMSVLLGENMSSRLFQIVREDNGLAYAISSGMQLFDETGLFSVDAGLDADRTPAALDLIFRELGRLRSRAPTAKELRQAKDYAIGQLRLGLESSTNQMTWCAEQLISYGDILQPEEIVAKLESVRAGEIRALAAEVFQPRCASTAIISPLAASKLESHLSRLQRRHL